MDSESRAQQHITRPHDKTLLQLSRQCYSHKTTSKAAEREVSLLSLSPFQHVGETVGICGPCAVHSTAGVSTAALQPWYVGGKRRM